MIPSAHLITRPQQSGMECVTRIGSNSNGPALKRERILKVRSRPSDGILNSFSRFFISCKDNPAIVIWANLTKGRSYHLRKVEYQNLQVHQYPKNLTARNWSLRFMVKKSIHSSWFTTKKQADNKINPLSPRKTPKHLSFPIPAWWNLWHKLESLGQALERPIWSRS
jgi:hypothetical protein